jgi:hypothetical protein
MKITKRPQNSVAGMADFDYRIIEKALDNLEKIKKALYNPEFRVQSEKYKKAIRLIMKLEEEHDDMLQSNWAKGIFI